MPSGFVVVAACLTTSVQVVLLMPNVLSPLYVATIKWLPAASVERFNVALPFERLAFFAIPPSITKLTVPVAFVVVKIVGNTVAVNVTDWLNVEGANEAETVVVVSESR